MNTPTVPFFIAHRGCPHQCVFCDQEKISGFHGSYPADDEIRKKVSDYRRSSGAPGVEVAFFGGSFTSLPRSDQEQLLLPLKPLMATGEVSSIRVSTRPDAVDGDCASFLRSMGVTRVELGVQSMDDGVLTLAERGHSAADVVGAVSLLKDEGIIVGVQLMPGLPGDTPLTSVLSLERVLELGPDFLRIYPTLVLAGTPLSRWYTAGRYQPLPLREAVLLCKVMLHQALLSGVPVIRMGLQPTSELERPGVVVAGPFHPAFRQLVEADLCYDLLDFMLLGHGPHDTPVVVSCAPSRISDVIGQGRSNMNRLLKERGIRIEGVHGDPRLTRLELAVARSGASSVGTILRDLKYNAEEIFNG